MRKPLLTVFLKELRDSLRDRRTALMVLIASILTGPVTLVLVAQFVSGLEEKAATLKVRIAGQEHAPALVNFLQRMDVEMETAPADYEARIKAGRLDAVIVVPKDFDERYYQAAPPDQQIALPKAPLEVALANLTPDGQRHFELPFFEAPVNVFPKRGDREDYKATLDTIVFEPDQERLTMTWRVATLPILPERMSIGTRSANAL